MAKQAEIFDQLEGTPLKSGVDAWEINHVDPFKQRTDKQIILGNVPAKSNCYRIVTFKPKKEDLKEFTEAQFAKINELFYAGKWNELRDELNTSGDGSKRSHATLVKASALKDYEKEFVKQATLYRGKNIQTDFQLTVDVYFPTKRSDLDNSLKVLLDCLQQIGAIANDNLNKRIIAEKYVDKDNPRIEFSLKEIGKTD